MRFPEHSNTSEDGDTQKDAGYAPHKLVQHQKEDADYHDIHEDMENTEISDNISHEEKSAADEAAEELEKDTISTSYDALD